MKKFIVSLLAFGGTVFFMHSASAASLTERGTTTYTEGKFGQAAVIGASNLVQLEYQNSVGFTTPAGTVEMWVKPQDWSTDSAGYWELLNVTDPQGDLFEFRRGKDASHDNLQFITYNANGSFNGWVTSPSTPFTWVDGTWYHLAVTWSTSTAPTFYVNGVAYASVHAYSETSWASRAASEGTVVLGQRNRFYPNASSGQPFHYAARAAFDEVRVSKSPRTAAEILASYNAGTGVLLTLDAPSLWLAHFDSDLAIEVQDLEANLSRACVTKATASSTVGFGSGKVKQAVDFTVKKPLVQYTCTSGSIMDTTEGTVEFWFKPGSEWTPTFHGYHHLFSLTDDQNNDRLLIRHGQDSTWNHLQAIFYRQDGSFQGWTMTLDEQFTWEIGSWYHVALTWSKTGSPTFYINGKKLSMRSAYGETTWTMGTVESGKATLGTRNSLYDSSAHADADVAIDELRVSSRARTLAEIQANYNAGIGVAVTEDASTLWLTHLDNTLTSTDTTIDVKAPVKAESAGKDAKRTVKFNNVFAASVSRIRIGKISSTFTLDPSTNVLTLTFDQTKLKPGTYDLQIVVEGKTITFKNAIIILGKKPVITSKPVQVTRAKRTSTITIKGKNFTSSVKVAIGPKGVQPTRITRKSSTLLILDVPTAKFRQGSYAITVTNADQQRVVLKNGLKVR